MKPCCDISNEANAAPPFELKKPLKLDQYLRAKNWNIFAGDPEYRTNFLLQFKVPFTFIRYQQDQFVHYKKFMQCHILATATMYLLLSFFAEDFSFPGFCLAVAGFVSSYALLHLQFSNWAFRMLYFLPELFWTRCLFSVLHRTSFAMYLVLVHVSAITLGIFFTFL